MYIYERMSSSVACVRPDFTLSRAYQIMTESGHGQLPVVDGENKLIGIVTEQLLAQVNPSKATSLSVYEINYLLSKTKVMDIMRTGIFSINKDRLIEDAALIMKENHISALPVVDNGNTLAGIITKDDIFKAFIDITAVKLEGTRIIISAEGKENAFSEIIHISEELKLPVKHISDFSGKARHEINIKLETENTNAFVEAIKALGYEIIQISSKG